MNADRVVGPPDVSAGSGESATPPSDEETHANSSAHAMTTIASFPNLIATSF
jgi:hypothetical protein